MGEGMTPVIRFDDDVLLKMDYLMPTLSLQRPGRGCPCRPLQRKWATTTAMTAVFIAS